jgi:hypothetical protein
LGVLLAWAFDATRFYIQQRPFHAVWDGIIGDQRHIPIVIGGIKQGGFHPENTPPGSETPLPSNVHLIAAQDTIASSLLQQRLVRVYGIDSAITESEGFNELRSTFVTVGGSSVNETTYDILVQRKLDKKFKMFYPEHYAIDAFDGTRYDPDITPDKKSIVKDFGFIMVGPNPYDQKKTVCVLFGIWPQGTGAALDALIDPDTESVLGRKFIEKLHTHRSVLAVVETVVNGLQQGRPVFVKVRDLAQ